MKIRFVQSHAVKQGDGKGPKYEKDQVVDFKGAVEETYARKYIRLGLAVEEDGRSTRAAATTKSDDGDAAKLAERSAVLIPDEFAKLQYAELQALAEKLTDRKVNGKNDAIAVIEAELKRRAA